MRRRLTAPTLSWALYDWANSAYATIVIAGFFPVLFKQYWAADLAVEDSTFWLGVANSIASVVVAIIAPLLGAIADRAACRKKFLLRFAVLGIVMTTALYFVAAGSWMIAIVIYMLASIGFAGGNIFYDALLTSVSSDHDRDRVSALGYALGYLGGGLLLALVVIAINFPSWFGLIDAGVVIKASFIIVALWWGVFSLPLWWSLDEPGTAPSMSTTQMVAAGWIQLSATFRQVRERRTVWVFLCAYWLYIDGVDTVVRMAVDYGLSLGFESNDLIAALLLTQLVGVPATLLWGRVARVTGAKNGILLGLAIYVLITLLASRITQVWEFFAIAAMIGVAQGGVQALSRSYYAGLIPADASAEFFGFYNLLGKFAAVIGPLLMGWVGVISGDPRLGMLSLLVLFVSGGWLLQWNKVS